MTTHTPAPWHIPAPWGGFTHIEGPQGELLFGLAAGSADEKQSDETCEANARLIAAAPELYAALRDLLDVRERALSVEAVLLPCVTAARAALAKVEGR